VPWPVERGAPQRFQSIRRTECLLSIAHSAGSFWGSPATLNRTVGESCADAAGALHGPTDKTLPSAQASNAAASAHTSRLILSRCARMDRPFHGVDPRKQGALNYGRPIAQPPSGCRHEPQDGRPRASLRRHGQPAQTKPATTRSREPSSVPNAPRSGLSPRRRSAGDRRRRGFWCAAILAVLETRQPRLGRGNATARESWSSTPRRTDAVPVRHRASVATSSRRLQRVFTELTGGAFRDELAVARMQPAPASYSGPTRRLRRSPGASAIGTRAPREGLSPSHRRVAERTATTPGGTRSSAQDSDLSIGPRAAA
jgi:hypothetical protein